MTDKIFIMRTSNFICQARGCLRSRNRPFKTSAALKQHQRHCAAFREQVSRSYETQMESIDGKKRRIECVFDEASNMYVDADDKLEVSSLVTFDSTYVKFDKNTRIRI